MVFLLLYRRTQVERNSSDTTLDLRRRRRRREVMISSGNTTFSNTSLAVFDNNDVEEEFPTTSRSDPSTDVIPDITESSKDGDIYTYFYKEIPINQTKYVLTELKHYSRYTITVKACRSGTQGTNCSNESIISVRTAKIGII